MPGIGRNLFSAKSPKKKGVISIFDFDNPRLELSGIIVLLRAEDGNLCTLVFDLGADSHEGKELANNAMTNAQLWHRRLGHLNKRSLELMQRLDGNAVTFDGSIDHCHVCVMGKRPQLAHPKKVKHADITAPFQLVYGNLMGPFNPTDRGGYEYVSDITDQFTKWTVAYLLYTKDQALASLQLFVTSTVIPFGSRIATWRADKGSKYTGEDFKVLVQAPAPAPGPAPTPASAAPGGTNRHANRGTVGVTPAITRSRAARHFPVPVATRYGEGRNNDKATLAKLFEAGTPQRLSELELGPPCYLGEIVHQAENASSNVEYAYVATNALGRF